jgi:hypothetical protein
LDLSSKIENEFIQALPTNVLNMGLKNGKKALLKIKDCNRKIIFKSHHI